MADSLHYKVIKSLLKITGWGQVKERDGVLIILLPSNISEYWQYPQVSEEEEHYQQAQHQHPAGRYLRYHQPHNYGTHNYKLRDKEYE